MRKLILFSVLLCLLSPVYAADSYKEQLKQYKLIYIEMLETKIEKIPTNVTIEVFLTDGTSVRGTFLKYSRYSDALWIHPLNARWGFFSDEAFDIRQIQDVTIIVIRNI